MTSLFLSERTPIEPVRTLFSSLEPETLEAIELLSLKTGLSRSEIVNSCLRYSLGRLEIVDPE